MTAAHTPTPWAVGFSDGTGQTWITAGDHPARKDVSGIAVVVSGDTDDWGVTHGVKNSADAAHIVECVNRHEALINVVRRAFVVTEAGLPITQDFLHQIFDALTANERNDARARAALAKVAA